MQASEVPRSPGPLHWDTRSLLVPEAQDRLLSLLLVQSHWMPVHLGEEFGVWVLGGTARQCAGSPFA